MTTTAIIGCIIGVLWAACSFYVLYYCGKYESDSIDKTDGVLFALIFLAILSPLFAPVMLGYSHRKKETNK